MLLNSFPFPLDRITMLRIPGVLQRIGVCYIAAALLTLRSTTKQQIAIVGALLLGYWAAITLVPVPGQSTTGRALLDEPSASLAAWLDRSIFGEHLWRSSKTWDPEGLLATIPAIGTVVLGVLAGRWLGDTQRPISERLTALFAVGGLRMVAGLMSNWVFPINKNISTTSCVLSRLAWLLHHLQRVYGSWMYWRSVAGPNRSSFSASTRCWRSSGLG